MRDTEWTRILRWPGYLVYQQEVNEKAKTLRLWVRRKPETKKRISFSLALETKTGPARVFGLKLKGLLREGLQLWKMCFTEEGKQSVEDLEERLK